MKFKRYLASYVTSFLRLIWRKLSKYAPPALGVFLVVLFVQAIKCLYTQNCSIETRTRGDGLHADQLWLKQASGKAKEELLRRSNTEHGDKWIVVITRLDQPTPEIRQLSLIPGWKLVIVAETKETDWIWEQRNVIFLNPAAQLNLGYSILKHLPWNNYVRKIVGYLYAIQNGAKIIYDAEDHIVLNDPATFEINFVLNKTTRGLILDTSANLVNPYAHFGQRKFRPRGYPSGEATEIENKTYITCPMHTPLIQEGLINEYMDSNARLDTQAPPVIYPKSVFASFSSQNTIFRYDAFWSLLLPVSIPFPTSDIWRSYWAQPLLWQIGGNVGFYPPKTIFSRASSSRTMTNLSETSSQQVSDLFHFLSTWKCTNDTLYKCMFELTESLVHQNLWASQELHLLRAWISDLENVRYKKPEFLNRPLPCLKDAHKSIAVFTPNDPSEVPDQSRSMLRKFCKMTSPNLPPVKLRFPETLLIVPFNSMHYKNIRLLDLIYRPHYPNILYCGRLPNPGIVKSLLSSEIFKSNNVTGISFVRALNIYGGDFAYECVLRAIDMKYSVSGYLVVADDTLLNFWNTGSLNHGEMWIQPISKYINIKTNQIVGGGDASSWIHWIPGKNATMAGLKAIRESQNPLVQEFRANFKRHGIREHLIACGYSDIFYVPASKQEMFYAVGTLLWEAQTFLEIAMPRLAAGLSSPTDMVQLSGWALWGRARRASAFDFFNASQVFLHPVKLMLVVTDERWTQKYCKYYVSHVLRYN